MTIRAEIVNDVGQRLAASRGYPDGGADDHVTFIMNDGNDDSAVAFDRSELTQFVCLLGLMT